VYGHELISLEYKVFRTVNTYDWIIATAGYRNKRWVWAVISRVNNFFLWHCGPKLAMASIFLRFLDHTQRRITVARTPLEE